MEYTHEVKLNLEPAGILPVVRVKQGDASMRYLHATIFNGAEQLEPETGMTVVFREEKPDGTGVMLDSEITDPELNRKLVILNNDGTVTVELVEQTTTCQGRCPCDLCLLQDGKNISTISFVLEVFPSPVTNNLADSSSDFRTIANALDVIEEYINDRSADDRYY